MAWTWIVFLALTALFVFAHVRSRRRGAEAAGGASGRSKCPRCSAAIAPDQESCSRCHAPLSAFELVVAPVIEGETPSAAESGPKHALVRTDVCVGCGTCVGACPEPGALRVESHRAIVDPDRCKAHGRCVEACPTGAIVLTSGGSVQRVEVPWVSANFESSIPGLYVVGELGGRGLIKNAVNEGRMAVEHIASRAKVRATPLSREAYDVAIVGSGPAGLSAGLQALRSGLRYVVLEQGNLTDTIRKYPRKKLLLAEPVRVPLYGELWVSDGTKEALLSIWTDMLRKTGLQVQTGRRVESVERDADEFRIVTAAGAIRARTVVLALGRRGSPRKLDVRGEDLDKVFYDIVEMEEFQGLRCLVVGGGDSAVESATGLANQPGTSVTLSYRGRGWERVKPRNREKLQAATAAGRITAIEESVVREIRPEAVALDTPRGPLSVPNDVVIVRIGGDPPFEFLKRAGVRIVQKEIAMHAEAQAAG